MPDYIRYESGDTLDSVGTGDDTHSDMHEEIADGLEASEVMSFLFAVNHYR